MFKDKQSGRGGSKHVWKTMKRKTMNGGLETVTVHDGMNPKEIDALEILVTHEPQVLAKWVGQLAGELKETEVTRYLEEEK